VIFSGNGMPMSPVFPFGTRTYATQKYTYFAIYAKDHIYGKTCEYSHEGRSINKLQIGVNLLVFKM